MIDLVEMIGFTPLPLTYQMCNNYNVNFMIDHSINNVFIMYHFWIDHANEF